MKGLDWGVAVRVVWGIAGASTDVLQVSLSALIGFVGRLGKESPFSATVTAAATASYQAPSRHTRHPPFLWLSLSHICQRNINFLFVFRILDVYPDACQTPSPLSLRHDSEKTD